MPQLHDIRCSYFVARVYFGMLVATTIVSLTARPSVWGEVTAENARLYREAIQPIWAPDESMFLYRRELPDNQHEFIRVDTNNGTRQVAFDHQRLAASLTAAIADPTVTIESARLPIERLEIVGDGSTIRFRVNNLVWECGLNDYQCRKLNDSDIAGTADSQPGNGNGRRRGRRRFRRPTDAAPSDRSPDGLWTAFVQDGNLFVRPLRSDDTSKAAEADSSQKSDASPQSENADERSQPDLPVQLSTDGSPTAPYDLIEWSADSRTLIAFRVEPSEGKEVFLVESSPRDGGRARLHQRPYALPGDRLHQYELNLFDVSTKRQIKPAMEKLEMEWERPRLVWNRDKSRFAFSHVDRGHQRFRVTSVDLAAGQASPIIDERTKTFIWTAHAENLGLDLVTWLAETDELIYASENDGWRHLYLYEARPGGASSQITQGEYVVRGIDRIDEQRRQIWFHASGKNKSQDPYFVHYYRVGFDGQNLVELTSGNGDHSVQLSPQGNFLIDTYSQVDVPPIHELRRVADGSLVCEVDRADISELQATGWLPMESFVSKGRDGTTDIWGVICRPRDFDPERRYPILESVYAGPQSSYVPKAFTPRSNLQAMADLGFIVVQIDGMGTANRSKAFHDVCWHNLKDAGFPDRIAWIRAAAGRYSAMDLARVGIYGGSAGGQNAAAALLFHNDFYKAAVAGCGCHDNRMDKASWNEQWMGYPVGPHYAECSNIDNAPRLQGHLMLILGEMDDNVPIESTLRFVDALIRADKDFEFVFVPGAGHGMGGAYGQRKLREFFVRHLQVNTEQKAE